MKIAASLYSTNLQDLPSLVHELDALQLDYFHIDCFEGQEQKVRKDILAIQGISDTPIDLHAIGASSETFFQLADDLNVKQLTLQLENLEGELSVPKNRTYKFGLAIVNDTSLASLAEYTQDIDYILLMTTTPGKSGGTFQKSSFERIRQCKKQYPKLPIFVDGGINAEVSFVLRLLGVSQAVSGSFLVNHDNIALALADLRFHQKGSSFLVEDFMLDKASLPLINKHSCSVKELIQTMDDFGMGFVLLEEQGKLVGICSNADLRKGILKNIDNLNQLQVEDMINSTPITISNQESTYEMISLIKATNFPILFLPVVDEEKNLKGVITFNELIKGEG